MRIPKPACFLLEGLNALATTYHFYYIYFFAAGQFGFSNGQNLLLATGLGLIYAAASVFGGRVAQRRGYLNAHAWGCLLMSGAQIVATGADSLAIHAVAATVGVVGMGMTWPALEALACEGESGPRLQTMLGVYNLVWSLGGAFAYLTGGAMIESWGSRSIFIVPAILNALQLGVMLRLCGRSRPAGMAADGALPPSHSHPAAPPRRADAGRFLRMAWFANPLAYLTINTV